MWVTLCTCIPLLRSPVASCISEEGQGPLTSATPDAVAELPDASCGCLKLCRRKKKSKTFRRIYTLSLSPREGAHFLRLQPGLFPFCLAKIIKLFFFISSKLRLHVSIWHQWTGSQNSGNMPPSLTATLPGNRRSVLCGWKSVSAL